MPNDLELLVKTVATLIATSSAIILAWKGRNKWEPSEEELSKGSRRMAGLLVAVGITLLWVVFFDVQYFSVLLQAIIYLIVSTVIVFIGYGILISVYTFKKKNGKRIIGGFQLRPQAIVLKGSHNGSVQEVFKALDYNPDKTWTTLSRSLSKALFSLAYILLMFLGSLTISVAAVIFIIKSKRFDPVPPPINKEILHVGFVLNGNASYAQEAMEGFKDKLDSLLQRTKYEANYEYTTGFAESTKETENLKVINELIDRFRNSPDYIVSIGTEVTKVLKQNYLNKYPIIFTAISYPIEDSITMTYEADYKRGNIAGVAYDDPAKNLLDFLNHAFPNKRFGFIYNPIFKQDLSMYNRLTKLASKTNTKIAFISTDTTTLTNVQASQADIFFGRYFLLTRLKLFLEQNDKPFVGNDLLFVKKGALACLATPAKELGGLAAEKVLYPNLIDHISLSDIPIVLHRNPKTSFNLRAARKYNVTVNQDVIKKASLVIE